MIHLSARMPSGSPCKANISLGRGPPGSAFRCLDRGQLIPGFERDSCLKPRRYIRHRSANLNGFISACRRLTGKDYLRHRMYRVLLRPLFFLFPSETAHQLAMTALRILVMLPLGKPLVRLLFGHRSSKLERTVFGLRFKNPLGIAAGFDKNGTYIDALAALGFGCIEIGTVTPRPQPGNPKPRLFRLKRSQALINRMGFNNAGCIAVADNLEKYRNRTFVLGANIGKNKDTPNDQALDDYTVCFDALHPYVDYFVVNVSSPNTPGLRALQEREPLMRILEAVQQRNAELAQRKPLLLKIAPDLTDGQVADIIDIAQTLRLDGIIVSNTTISREGLSESHSDVEALGNGGLSGRPLQQRAQALLSEMRQQLPDHIVLVGVGGIDSGEAAKARVSAGAALVQIYTGFIYQGPGLIRRILKAL